MHAIEAKESPACGERPAPRRADLSSIGDTLKGKPGLLGHGILFACVRARGSHHPRPKQLGRRCRMGVFSPTINMHKERVLRIVQRPPHAAATPASEESVTAPNPEWGGPAPASTAPTSERLGSASAPSQLTDQELRAIAAPASWLGGPGGPDPSLQAGLDDDALRRVANEAARHARKESAEAMATLRQEVEALSERLAHMRHALTEACEEAARAFTKAHDALEADAAFGQRGTPWSEGPTDEQLGRLVYEAIVSASKLHSAQQKVFRPWSEANDTVRAANIGAARAVRQRLESTLKKY